MHVGSKCQLINSSRCFNIQCTHINFQLIQFTVICSFPSNQSYLSFFQAWRAACYWYPVPARLSNTNYCSYLSGLHHFVSILVCWEKDIEHISCSKYCTYVYMHYATIKNRNKLPYSNHKSVMFFLLLVCLTSLWISLSWKISFHHKKWIS